MNFGDAAAPRDESLIQASLDKYSEEISRLESAYCGQPLPVSFRHLVGPLPADESTHGLYPYPARLIRHIPRFFLRSGVFTGDGELTVLDPFCGSGTVLVEAQRSAHKSWGIDSNPIAHLISKVKTTPVPADVIVPLGEMVLLRAKRSRAIAVNSGFARKWFLPPVLSALQRLVRSIADLGCGPEVDLLMVCAALATRSASTMDPRIPVPVRSKNRAGFSTASEVWECFHSQLIRVSERVSRLPTAAHLAEVVYGDSRSETSYAGLSARPRVAIVSSPPYGAAQKYIRATSIEAALLGFSSPSGTRQLEELSIGREHILKMDSAPDLDELSGIEDLQDLLGRITALDSRRGAIYSHYFLDMQRAISAQTNLPGLQNIALVLGTNQVAGVALETHRYIAKMYEQSGFRTRLVLADAIHGRTLLTTRHRGGLPASAEYVYLLRRYGSGQ